MSISYPPSPPVAVLDAVKAVSVDDPIFHVDLYVMAGRRGIEPRFTVLEAVVLPLDERPIYSSICSSS